MKRKLFVNTLIFIIFLIGRSSLEAGLPDIDSSKVVAKLHEIMKAHVTHKDLSPTLVRRALRNYLEELDPSKTYFIATDIELWRNPPDDFVNEILNNYKDGNFVVFENIHEAMIRAIERRRRLEKEVQEAVLPEKVCTKEFKNLEWADSEETLLDRLIKIRALQVEATEKLNDKELKEKSFQRIAKKRASFEEDILSTEPKQHQQFLLSNVLKATASALDSHTCYFTPAEATQFMINVQQRLCGIGAQLRDDINGFTVVKIIEGGPAFNNSQLKAKDKIIAVDGEPVVGMDITDAVELIRGEENTPVILRVIREVTTADGAPEEQKLDITVTRGEVVLKESRLESSFEPFGDGIIAYLRLFSFYQDPESSSAFDIAQEIQKLKNENNVKGVILDLRSNSGGMLSQAVAVTGLFITKGIIVSIKDDRNHIQHLRDLDGQTIWDGPLIILVNRASASAAEIVAQTLQDYGRALIVGDDSTFGKGSFQTFTLTTNENDTVDQEGEYKVTRGKYYTVSGKSPQLIGVKSDVNVPSVFSAFDIGERFSNFPLENDSITENFNDNLSDIPWSQRDKIRKLYKFNLQTQLTTYSQHIPQLQKNSTMRIKNNHNYQAFLKDLENKDDNDEPEDYGQNDLQLTEAYNIIKDLIVLTQSSLKA